MTKQEVIEALIHCARDDKCTLCPFYMVDQCFDKLMLEAARHLEEGDSDDT